MGWAEEEFLGIDLADKRRDGPAIRVVERLARPGSNPSNGAC
jgi:hypothetical protein